MGLCEPLSLSLSLRVYVYIGWFFDTVDHSSVKSKTLDVHTFNNHHPDRQKVFRVGMGGWVSFEFARGMGGWVGEGEGCKEWVQVGSIG